MENVFFSARCTLSENLHLRATDTLVLRSVLGVSLSLFLSRRTSPGLPVETSYLNDMLIDLALRR